MYSPLSVTFYAPFYLKFHIICSGAFPVKSKYAFTRRTFKMKLFLNQTLSNEKQKNGIERILCSGILTRPNCDPILTQINSRPRNITWHYSIGSIQMPLICFQCACYNILPSNISGLVLPSWARYESIKRDKTVLHVINHI